MDQVLDAHRSVLIGQVRQADASHKFDTVHNLLRGKRFTGPSRVVYLGDVAQACLAQLTNAETPVFEEHPGYNEQRWSLRTTSGDLNVHIASHPYWAWGLMTSGYLNIITLEGPLAERARLVLCWTPQVLSVNRLGRWRTSEPLSVGSNSSCLP